MAAEVIRVPVQHGPVTLHTPIVSPRDMAALSSDVRDVLDRVDLDEEERAYLEGVAAALGWVVNGGSEPDLPVEKCDHCGGRGGWGDDYKDVECSACQGEGWVR